jgi:hypothetical protein
MHATGARPIPPQVFTQTATRDKQRDHSADNGRSRRSEITLITQAGASTVGILSDRPWAKRIALYRTGAGAPQGSTRRRWQQHMYGCTLAQTRCWVPGVAARAGPALGVWGSCYGPRVPLPEAIKSPTSTLALPYPQAVHGAGLLPSQDTLPRVHTAPARPARTVSRSAANTYKRRNRQRPPHSALPVRSPYLLHALIRLTPWTSRQIARPRMRA